MTAEAKKQGRGMVCIAWVLLSENQHASASHREGQLDRTHEDCDLNWWTVKNVEQMYFPQLS